MKILMILLSLICMVSMSQAYDCGIIKSEQEFQEVRQKLKMRVWQANTVMGSSNEVNQAFPYIGILSWCVFASDRSKIGYMSELSRKTNSDFVVGQLKREMMSVGGCYKSPEIEYFSMEMMRQEAQAKRDAQFNKEIIKPGRGIPVIIK